MNKSLLFFCLLMAVAGFSDSLVLENRTSYPAKKSKMAVQWATSSKEVEEGNYALMHKAKLNPATLQALTHQGVIDLTIPKKAEYFRVLVWSKGEGEPDFHTNWVDIVPDKTYTLKADHLVPAVLMLGMGC